MSEQAITLDVDLGGLDQSIRELSGATGKPIHKEGKAQMRLLIKDAIAITPPGGGGVTGVAAKKRGEAAIAGDLFGGREVDMGGFRVKTDGLFIVSNTDPNAFSDHVAEFQSQNNTPKLRKKEAGEDEIARLYTNKKGEVYGVEKQLFRPNASVGEMLSHIARYRSKATGRVSRAGLRDQVIGRHVFIDKMVINVAAKTRLLKHLFGHVGKLAGNWLPAIAKTGAPAPAWVKRHGSPHGSAAMTPETAADFAFQATNEVAFGRAGKTIRSRLVAAARLRVAAIGRAIPHIVQKRAKKAGFG